ncbi:hypothetical protein Tco_0105852, partial [Tanacetum coccineum]
MYLKEMVNSMLSYSRLSYGAFRFYVIEPNEFVSINSITESRDLIFDENRFLSIPRLSHRIPNTNGTDDHIGVLVVPKEDEPKNFDEAMKSRDIAFWKETINDEMDSIMENNTFVLADLPPCYKPLSCKWIFKRKMNIDGTIEKFKARLVLKKFNYFDYTLVSTPIDTNEKLIPNNSQTIYQLEYSMVIGCLMYAMTCTRLDIAFEVGKLSSYTSNPSYYHWQVVERKLKSTTLKIILLQVVGYSCLGEGLSHELLKIKLASQESQFVALAAGKEIEYEVTLAKAYNQMYNGKSRHLGFRNNMIRELIINGVILIEF